MKTVGVENGPGTTVHLADIGQAETLGLAPQEKILGHGEIGQEVDLLMTVPMPSFWASMTSRG